MVDGNSSDMRRRGRGRLLLAALAVAGGLTVTGAWAAAPKAGLVIGAIVPESAPDKTSGEEIRNGMLLALKTWPGQPAPTVIVKDDACDPKQAAAAAQELAAAKVDIVVGGYCAVGTVPRVLADAGVPFISANAVRFPAASDAFMQFGAVPQSLPASVGFKLRSDIGLRVIANSTCWIDYDQKVPNGYDAALCPTLHIDQARWNDIAPTYLAAYRKPFSKAAARGYAAMQVALAGIKQLRLGSKPISALKDVKEVSTVLGTVRYGDTPLPDDAMQLILAAQLPRMSPREAATLEELKKTRGCACSKTGECPPGAWSGLVVQTPACKQ